MECNSRKEFLFCTKTKLGEKKMKKVTLVVAVVFCLGLTAFVIQQANALQRVRTQFVGGNNKPQLPDPVKPGGGGGTGGSDKSGGGGGAIDDSGGSGGSVDSPIVNKAPDCKYIKSKIASLKARINQLQREIRILNRQLKKAPKKRKPAVQAQINLKKGQQSRLIRQLNRSKNTCRREKCGGCN
jgi:hypothetical protein